MNRVLLTLFLVISSFSSLFSQSWKFIDLTNYAEGNFGLSLDLSLQGTTAYVSRYPATIVKIDGDNITSIANDSLRKIVRNPEELTDDSFSDIWRFTFNKQGIMWGCAKDCVFQYDGDSITIYGYFYDPADDSVKRFQSAFNIALDNLDRVYVVNSGYDIDADSSWGTYAYLCKFNGGSFDCIYKHYRIGKFMDMRHEIAFDMHNRLWKTESDKILIFYFDNLFNQISSASMPSPEYMYSSVFNQIEIDQKTDTKYLLNYALGFYVLQDTLWRFDNYIANLENRPAAVFNYTFSCLDSAGNFWTYFYLSKNLYKYSPNGYWSVYPIPVADTNSYTRGGIEADSLGRVWLGTENGIFIFDPNGISGIDGFHEYNADIKTESDIHILSLVPNPANDYATLDFNLANSKRSSLEAKLCNEQGEVVLDLLPFLSYDDSASHGLITFPTVGLANGTYFVLLATGGTKEMKKLAVIR
jgi:hypothetical protein